MYHEKISVITIIWHVYREPQCLHVQRNSGYDKTEPNNREKKRNHASNDISEVWSMVIVWFKPITSHHGGSFIDGGERGDSLIKPPNWPFSGHLEEICCVDELNRTVHAQLLHYNEKWFFCCFSLFLLTSFVCSYKTKARHFFSGFQLALKVLVLYLIK